VIGYLKESDSDRIATSSKKRLTIGVCKYVDRISDGNAFTKHALQERSCKVKRKWKERYGERFRRRAVGRMNACDNIIRLSRELGLNRSLLYKWRYRLEPPDSQVEGTASTENRRESTLPGEITK
jgi:hypothetical protein